VVNLGKLVLLQVGRRKRLVDLTRIGGHCDCLVSSRFCVRRVVLQLNNRYVMI
jgi:hypothetical protein